MRYNVTVAIVKEDDWYVASCLENHVASQGRTMEESLSNLKEALELYFEDGEDVPSVERPFITTIEIAV